MNTSKWAVRLDRGPSRTTLTPTHQPWQAADHQFAADRLRLIEAHFDQVNTIYRGGTLDWPVLDAIERRLRTVTTRREFDAAADEYRANVPTG